MKIKRNYDLLGRIARWLFPVTESEKKCAITRREHEAIRDKYKVRVMKHLFTVEDGLVIRIR